MRTRLYFTSESHLYTLLNVLRYPLSGDPCAFSEEGKQLLGMIPEVSYLSQVTIRLFDRTFRENDDPLKYRCEILFSPGACNDPASDKRHDLSPLVVLNK